MIRSTGLSACVALAFVAAGCGGGGGGDAAPAATTAFPVAAAMSAFVAQTGTLTVTGNGTISGLTGTGSGTVVRDAGIATTFEGAAAVSKRTVTNLTLQNSSGSASSSDVTVTYYDPLYTVPLGGTATGSYAVTTTKGSLPALAKIGDSGTWYTSTSYTASNKAVKTGTATVTYTLKSDTDTTAQLTLVTTAQPTSGAATVITATYRIGTSGAAVALQSMTSGPGVSTTIAYR